MAGKGQFLILHPNKPSAIRASDKSLLGSLSSAPLIFASLPPWFLGGQWDFPPPFPLWNWRRTLGCPIWERGWILSHLLPPVQVKLSQILAQGHPKPRSAKLLSGIPWERKGASCAGSGAVWGSGMGVWGVGLGRSSWNCAGRWV